jgi:hypothetical protein
MKMRDKERGNNRTTNEIKRMKTIQTKKEINKRESIGMEEMGR